MIPRLKAEDALDTFTVIAMGFGSLPKGEAARIMRIWHGACETEETRKKKMEMVHPEQMAAMGLGVEKVKSDG